MKSKKDISKCRNIESRGKQDKSVFEIVIKVITILNVIVTISSYFIYETKLLELKTKYLGIENELRPREFDNNLKLTLYKEVKDAITTKDSIIQQATLIIVNNMLDYDPIFNVSSI